MHRSTALLGLLFILAPSIRAATADPTPHNLLAHGDAQNFWIGRVAQATAALPNTPLARTTIYFRQLGDEGKWQPLTSTSLQARVVSIASQNGVAAALLDDGSWILLYPDTGPFNAKSLPQPARMIALAGGANAWWTVGLVPGGIAALPSTQPTSAPTQPASAATVTASASRPTSTQPAAGTRLVLLTFTGNDWKPVAELPEDVPGTASVSLAIIDDVPYVADQIPGGLRVRHLGKRGWVTDGAWADLPPLAGFKLLSNASVPLLWAEPLSGDDVIYTLNKLPPSVARLAPIPNTSPSDRTVVIATGKLRMLGIAGGDVVEQDYLLSSLKPDGSRFPVGLPQASAVNQIQRVQWYIVFLALVAALVGSLRQRTLVREGSARLAGLTLAPFGRRLAAGLIDAAPVLLGLAYLFVHFGSGPSVTEASRPVIYLSIYWSAGIFYVVYLTVIEVLAGRSLGKLLVGLRIVSLDGQPAGPGALVMRNVLRVIDVGLWLFPLLIITIFPLRQRAGDVAAGTLVVTGDANPANGETQEQAVASKEERT